MDGSAIVLTAGMYQTNNAKTAHGLVRGTDRYRIVGIIDESCAGQDAGLLLDGQQRDIPIYASLAVFRECSTSSADHLIIGVATKGGVLPPHLRHIVEEAIAAGMHIVNGLHEHLNDDVSLRAAADAHGVRIIDIRKPKPFRELHFWTGEILGVSCPCIPVLGTDCALGKRTTARLLTGACRSRAIHAEMIYTGQTGWLQGGDYGFIFDATPNDFVCGELERAIVACYNERKPDVIFIEGQSGLRNPSGPCGSEFIVSTGAKGVILQHAPNRTYFKGTEHLGCRIGALRDELALIRLLGAETLALAVNGEGIEAHELDIVKRDIEAELGIPVLDPLRPELDALVDLIEHHLKALEVP